MADSFELKAIITAVDQVSGPLRGMQRQLKGFQKEFTGLAIGAGAAGTAILGAFAGMVKESMGLENHMADARKAIEELHDPKVFQSMTDQLVEMSTRLPMSAEGLAEIVAEAGNAGIPFEDLTRFAEDATKAAVGFGMSAGEAGHQLAVWRSAMGLSQEGVMELSDQMNTLAAAFPTTEKQIASIVTSIGGMAQQSHIATSDLAAMAGILTGMGVQSDVAATGIKNLILGLTTPKTKAAVGALKAIGFTPKSVREALIKDSRGTILKVLENINKIPEKNRQPLIYNLFGSESLPAIQTLTGHMEDYKKALDMVSDRTIYTGATQKEFLSKASTLTSKLIILKNQFTAIALAVGDDFKPMLKEAADIVGPFIIDAGQFVKNNPEMVKSIGKFGVAMLGVATALGAVSRAAKLLNFAFNITPAKGAIALLIFGAYEIIEHWDKVGPVIMDVWHHIDEVAQAMGGWESAIKMVAAISAIYIGVKFIANIRQAIAMQKEFTAAANGTGLALKALGKISFIAGLLELEVYAAKLEKEFPWLVKNFAANALNSGFGLNDMFDKLGKQAHDYIYEKTGWQMPRGDDYRSGGTGYNLKLARQSTEVRVTFDNAPPGLRVADPKSGDPFMRVVTDVGYSPFRNPQ